MKKEFPLLYKTAKTGAAQQWQIIVENNTFYSIAGQVGGALTTSKPTVCKGKNTGKANETSGEEQALKEAQSKWTKKVESGYVEDIANIGDGPDYYECMLAKKYVDYQDKVWRAGVKVFEQPKLDGHRCIITKNGAQTRKGKVHKAIPHILKELVPFFKNQPDAILDGELYNTEFHDDFNTLSSIIRKQKPTTEDLILSEKYIQFHCYDAPVIGTLEEKDPFLDRYQDAVKKLSPIKYIRMVDTVEVGNHNDVMRAHEQFVAQGYEGIIIRLNKAYDNKRSTSLLKYKVFDDDEFVVEGIKEGKGNQTGMAVTIETHSKSGEPFEPSINGPHKFLVYVWQNKSKFIGKSCTVRYFGLTPDKFVPRFPKVIDLNREEYE